MNDLQENIKNGYIDLVRGIFTQARRDFVRYSVALKKAVSRQEKVSLRVEIDKIKHFTKNTETFMFYCDFLGMDYDFARNEIIKPLTKDELRRAIMFSKTDDEDED